MDAKRAGVDTNVMIEREVELTVDAADILPLIKQFLYAEREVFLRELVSNALDALTRLDKTYRFSSGFEEGQEPLHVEIRPDPVNRCLSISDNGDGMSEAEVIRNINQIAFSGARKFVEENVNNKERLIGRFGVGFYSCFMVANRVEIDTWSWRPDAGGCHWLNEGGTKTKLSEPQRRSRGTTITCHLSPEAEEFLMPDRLEKIIRRYLDFAPYPIVLAGSQANILTAPWHLSKVEREALPRSRFIELFKRLNPGENQPLTWLDVDIDFPIELHALLFVPDRGDGESGKIRLYSNRVFVCDHMDELLPHWLAFLDGVVDADDLPINVSRERFQLDHRFRQMGQFLTTKATELLGRMAKEQPKSYAAIWERYGTQLKRGFMESIMHGNSKLAAKLEAMLLFPSDRQSWVTLAQYQERQPDSAKRAFLYLSDERGQSVHLDLWRNRNREVLFCTHPLDAMVIELLKRAHPDWSYLRVDEAKLDEEASYGGTAAPPDQGVCQATEPLTELMRRIAGDTVGKITVGALPSRDVPVVFQMAEDAIQQELMGKLGGKQPPRTPSRTLLLNSNSILIQRLVELTSQDVCKQLVLGLATQLWDSARLNAGLLAEGELLPLVRRNSEFLTLVAQELAIRISKPH